MSGDVYEEGEDDLFWLDAIRPAFKPDTPMVFPDVEPPSGILLGLDEALELLAALEDAAATFGEHGMCAGAIEMNNFVELFYRRLELC